MQPRADSARIHPLVWGAAVAALLALPAGGGPAAPPAPATASPGTGAPALSAPLPSAAASTDRAPAGPALCGPRQVPEGDVCLPLPPPGAASVAAAPEAPPRGPRLAQEELRIPRLPERPAELSAYAYPVEVTGAPHLLATAGEDDDALDLLAERGAEVRVLALEHQQGQAEVAFVGELYGVTVVTVHTVEGAGAEPSGARDGGAGRTRRYALLHGHLDRPGPGVVAGARLGAGDVLGFVGDTGTPGVVHLRFAALQLQDGVDLASVDLSRLEDASVSIACDARNVLPPKP